VHRCIRAERASETCTKSARISFLPWTPQQSVAEGIRTRARCYHATIPPNSRARFAKASPHCCLETVDVQGIDRHHGCLVRLGDVTKWVQQELVPVPVANGVRIPHANACRSRGSDRRLRERSVGRDSPSSLRLPLPLCAEHGNADQDQHKDAQAAEELGEMQGSVRVSRWVEVDVSMPRASGDIPAFLWQAFHCFAVGCVLLVQLCCCWSRINGGTLLVGLFTGAKGSSCSEMGLRGTYYPISNQLYYSHV